MVEPNFLIIGAAKSGTTSLANYMSQHPEIFLSPQKEVTFFPFANRVPDFKGPGDESLNKRIIVDHDNYLKLFSEVTFNSNIKAVGEASIWYLYDKHSAPNIKSLYPKMKLLALLRNPIERAFSCYLMTLREGRETAKSFEESLFLEPKRINLNWEYIWHYINAGFYYNQVNQYLDLFSPHQINIHLYDEFQSEPNTLLRTIFNFLEVDSSFKPNMNYRLNLSGIPKSLILNNLLNRPNYLKRISKVIIPSRVRRIVRFKFNKFNLFKPVFPEELRPVLLSIYRDDILRLQDLLKRDLSVWLNL